MKKKIVFLISLLYLISAQSAFAVTNDWVSKGCVQKGVATLQCIPYVFENIINWVIAFAGITALFFVIYGGIKYVRSGGEEEKIKSARETLTYAIIGLSIVILSFAIITFIGAVTGVTCITQFGFGNCR